MLFLGFQKVVLATLLIVIALITSNVYNLMLQKAFSESSALILLMASYLVFNDDLIVLNFLSFNNSIINDYFAFCTKILICFFSAFYFLITANSLKEQKLTSFEYSLIIILAILGLLLMCGSNDFLTAYLAIELSSLAFYVLASFRKVSSYSVESGIKYFVTGAVSSAFFLLGSSFIYGLTGSINFSDFQDLFNYSEFYFYPDIPFNCRVMLEFPINFTEDEWLILPILQSLLSIEPSVVELFNYSFAEFGLTLILFSLFIKLSLAPFHLWSLDVYEGAPTSSTVFFAVITKLRCEVTRVCLVQSRVLSLFKFVVFILCKNYVKRSNNLCLTVNRIGTISLTFFCGGSFIIKWLGYT
jgi:NADH-quinone oxidoreductase subunit N